MPPLVGDLEEQCAARGVVGLLGRASAVVGVAVIELSEELGTHSWRRRRRPEPLPSTITLAGGSQDAAVPFERCGLIFVHFGLDSERFRPAPWTYRPPRWQAEVAVIGGGGSRHVRHGTAGVRCAARRCGGGVAACGAWAAGADARGWVDQRVVSRNIRLHCDGVSAGSE